MCGTPLETKAGTAGLENPDLEKAKALLKESGYDGRPVVFMQPSDLAANVNATVVVEGGMSIDGAADDSILSSVVTRHRLSRLAIWWNF